MNIHMVNHAEFVFQSEGITPEEFLPYLVAYRTKNGKLGSMVGVFEPDYDQGNGGFYDGVMAHLTLEDAYAWLDLSKIQLTEET